MKMLKSILVTVLCAFAILAVGYMGIIAGGMGILKTSTEPEPVDMTGNISNLFYSKIEDDVQLYPWNYYPKDGGTQVDVEADMTQQSYDPYLESNLFYPLISIAADVEAQEVSQWYQTQEKTIMESMVKGEDEGNFVDIYFYQDAIRLNGKEYQVKIACSGGAIMSFSCMEIREDNVKDTAKWNENKEIFMSWVEENPDIVLNAFYCMWEMYLSTTEKEYWDWYVDFYAVYLKEFQTLLQQAEEVQVETQGEVDDASVRIWGVNTAEGGSTEAQSKQQAELEEMPIQMVELKDNILLLMESDVTVGIYFDVIEQRVVGFHFF